jgi:excisionase family DNA binding protein
MKTIPPRLLLNVREVAELTGFSAGTLFHWVSQRRIPYVRLSPRCIRFRLCDLENWLTERVETPNDPMHPTGNSTKSANRSRRQIDPLPQGKEELRGTGQTRLSSTSQPPRSIEGKPRKT